MSSDAPVEPPYPAVPPALAARPDIRRGRAWSLLLVILLAGAVLRCSFSVGPAASDDTRYMRAAAAVAEGKTQDRLDHGWVRAAFILWLAAWVKLGAGTQALAISDIILSLGIMLAIYWLGAKWTSRRAALLALTWLAFFPLELLCSGVVVSDHLGVLLALLAAGLACDGLAAQPAGRTGRLLLAATLCALAVSAKEVYVVLPIVCGLWALINVRPLKTAVLRTLAMGAAALAVFSLEHLFFWWWTGDWAYRYHAISAKYGAYPPISHLGVRDLMYYPLQILLNPEVSGAFGWIMLAALCCCWRRMNDRRMVLLWTVCFFLFMQYGSTSFDRYQPLPKQWRYMHPIIILLFIPLGHWTLALWRSPLPGRLGTLLVGAGIMVSALLTANERAAQRFYAEDALRCVAFAEADRAAGRWEAVVLPAWVSRARALDMLRRTWEWEVVDLSDGLQDDEAARFNRQGRVLLVPEIMWRQKGDEPAYVALHDVLRRGALAEPLRDWRSPLDRLAARFGLFHTLARKIVIGHYYQLPDTHANAATRSGRQLATTTSGQCAIR